MKAGNLKDWGGDLASQSGYAICEGLSDAEVAAVFLKYSNYFHAEITPVLTIDQASEVFNKVMAAAKKP